MNYQELYNQLKEIADSEPCGIWHQGKPKDGHTCLEGYDYVKSNPEVYGTEYRESILRGERFCFVCKVKNLLRSVEN